MKPFFILFSNKNLNFIFIIFILNDLNIFAPSAQNPEHNTVNNLEISAGNNKPSGVQGDDQKKYYNYASGSYKHKINKIDDAQKYFDNFFQNNTDPNIVACREYLIFLFDTKQFAKFEMFLKKHENKLKDDQQIQIYHAKILKNLGAKKESHNILDRLSQEKDAKLEVIYEIILNFLEKKDFKSIIDLLEKTFQENINASCNYIFNLILGKSYVYTGNLEKAKSYIEKALNLYPESNEGWLMLALINNELNNINDAIYGYQRFLDIVGTNKLAEDQILKLKLKLNLSSQTDLAESLIAYNSKDYKQALLLIEKVLKNDPNNIDASLIKIEILIATKNINQALDILAKNIESEQNLELYLELFSIIFNYAKDQNYNIKVLKNILKNSNYNIIITLYGADILFKASQDNLGAKYALRALKLTKDLDLQSKIIFQVAKVYYKNKNFKELQKLLSPEFLEKTNYGPLLNLAGYYYATNNNGASNILLAQKYSNRALRISPGNPHYLDTKAKILYGQKKYKESLEILEKIAKILPEDKFIKENLLETRNKINIKINNKN